VLFSLFTAYVLKSVPGLSTEYEKILDLVAMGTIGDLMPMVNENRILVRTGMRMMTEGVRKELLALMTMQNLVGKQLSTSDIGWQLTPVINASGRLGRPDVAVNMLLAKDMRSCEEFAGELMRLNKERQKQGEDSWGRLLPKARNSHGDFDGKFLMVEDATVSRGLTGIMASRLLRQFNVPSMVIAHLDNERVTGSIRSPQHFNVRDFLSTFEDLFLDFGGHRCAGGFSMEYKHLDALRSRIVQAIDLVESRDGIEDEPVLIDAELPPDYLTPKLISLVEIFEPYGEGNPPLQFLIRGANVEELQLLNRSKGSGAAHVKMQLQYGGFRWPALYWNGADDVGSVFNEHDEVDVVFRMGRNYFRNNETLQLTVVSVQKHKRSIEQIMDR
jgi:single-stranded-DNA-specific exonuclease